MSTKKYTISEAAEILDYEPHTLRFYEGEFDIHVPRDKSNRRQYTVKEIESFQYIKDLQNQGYNNTQIKEILKSPTVEEVATTTSIVGEQQLSETNSLVLREVAVHLESLSDTMCVNVNKINDSINNLSDRLDELKDDLAAYDKDVLISENAKLKLKVKEKTYELVDIKEKYAKLEEKKFVFKRLFR